MSLVTCEFIRTVPVEFFYFDQVFYFFGGVSTYYLGVYGFGAEVSAPEERYKMHVNNNGISSVTSLIDVIRASRLAIISGTESFAHILGTAISPYLFKAVGYFGTFCVRAGMTFVALLYLAVLVKEPMSKEKQKQVMIRIILFCFIIWFNLEVSTKHQHFFLVVS